MHCVQWSAFPSVKALTLLLHSLILIAAPWRRAQFKSPYIICMGVDEQKSSIFIIRPALKLQTWVYGDLRDSHVQSLSHSSFVFTAHCHWHVTVVILFRRRFALAPPPCSVVVCLLFHRPLALSSSVCSFIVPLLCRRLSALSSSPALSSSLCFFIVPLLSHSPLALSSSHYSVTIVPVLCHYSVLCYSPLGSITDR